MLRNLVVFYLGDSEPFSFMLENFANSAPLDTIRRCDVFLAGVGVLKVVLTYSLTFFVVKALLWLGRRRRYGRTQRYVPASRARR